MVRPASVGWPHWRKAKPCARVAAGNHEFAPFHWDIEFAEVFERANPGFDAVVGNPPYAGKNTYKKGNVPGFPEWLQAIHLGSHGNADLSAHFFLRGYDLLREGGALGFVATNTIRQGDTRESGLRALLARGATITRARRRLRWPGDAAVVVCVMHLVRGPGPFVPKLDDRSVTRISAFLEEGSRDAPPATLMASTGLAFQGSILLGMGFTFDDEATESTANRVAEMLRLTSEDRTHGLHNAHRIRPLIGGEEVNESPTHAHRRWTIDFGDMPLERRDDLEPSWAEASPSHRAAFLSDGIVPGDFPERVAADWPELLSIVRERVKPERDNDNRVAYRKFWWRYAERRADLANTTRNDSYTIVISRVTSHVAFARLPTGTVFANSLVIFARPGFDYFCVFQSRLHEVWARFFSSSLEDRLVYGLSDCLETFPLPAMNEATRSTLVQAGQAFHDVRAARMVAASEGLTGTHNRMDDPEERDPAILHLRTLHDAMDAAVLRAYCWPHPMPLPIHEPEWPGGEDDRPGPWRRRWPEADRARALEFLWQANEAQAATQPTGTQGRRAPGRRRTVLAPAALPLLEAS